VALADACPCRRRSEDVSWFLRESLPETCTHCLEESNACSWQASVHDHILTMTLRLAAFLAQRLQDATGSAEELEADAVPLLAAFTPAVDRRTPFHTKHAGEPLPASHLAQAYELSLHAQAWVGWASPDTLAVR